MIEIEISPNAHQSNVRDISPISRDINHAIVPFIQHQLKIPIMGVDVWDIAQEDGRAELWASVRTANAHYELEVQWVIGTDPVKVLDYRVDYEHASGE